MKKILFAFGTRPEAIKLAPLIHEAQERGLEVRVATTGQHREMLEPFLKFFKIKVDYKLDCMVPGQNLASLTGKILNALYPVLEQEKPNWLVVQGDTTTTYASALAAFYLKIPVVHVEAGLRTHDRYSPFPEEMNRLLVSKIADFHFAPTPQAKGDLEKEGIHKNLHMVGNTGIDALRIASAEIPVTSQKKILVTCHRRENHGQNLHQILDGVVEVSKRFPDYEIVFPVHLNPNVHGASHARLGSIKNVRLTPPLDYPDFIKEMKGASIILTDSGGVQEEAPYLKIPVLVLRESTERPEGVTAGAARLIGADTQKIIDNVTEVLTKPEIYKQFQNAINPYGDGYSSKRILDVMLTSS